MSQIKIVDPTPATLETLYGAAITDEQKKLAVGVTAGVIAGIALFVVVRKMKKSKRGR